MLELLFAVTFWPMALAVLLIIACVLSAFAETSIVAFVAMLIFSTITWWVYDSGPFIWIIDNPVNIILAVVVYAGIGGLWSLFKWRQWMLKDNIQRDLRSGMSSYKAKSDTTTPFIKSYHFPKNAQASENKNRIVSWISLWPFSALLFFVGDILGEMFNYVYELFGGVYAKITERYLPE